MAMEIGKNIIRGEIMQIAVVGAGGQGSAHAACLLKENWDGKVYNRIDEYTSDGIHDLSNGVRENIIYLLVSDDVHGDVYEKYIKPYETDKTVIIVAHAYSLYSKNLVPSNNISVGMIAPRKPGKAVYDAKMGGEKVTAFWDVFQGDCKDTLMTIASAIGYDLMHVPWAQECEVDLFLEQFFLPRIILLIEECYDLLTKKGISKEAALYELYQSGEVGMLLTEASKVGLLETFVNMASPTCRFGLNESILNLRKMVPHVNEGTIMMDTLTGIRDGSFFKRLKHDTINEMKFTKTMEKNFLEQDMSKSSKELRDD